MGLLTKEITMTLHAQLFKYFIDKGYDVPMKKATGHGTYENGMCYDNTVPITIKTEDLPKGSHQIVEVECDYCHKIIKIEYRQYKKSFDKFGDCTCSDCSKNHRIKTFQKMYGEGITNPFQAESVKKAIQETCMKKYGFPNAIESDEVKEKIKNTCIQKYNYPYALQVPKIREQIKKTCQEKYGGNAPTSSPMVKEKVCNSFYKNNTKMTSKQQRYICNLYNGELNYPISIYSADIALLDDKIVCEVDFSGHDLSVKLGTKTREEFKQAEIVRGAVLKRKGFKIIHLISSTDKLPSDEILLDILEQSKLYFKEYLNHSWREWYIDDNIYKDAEHKDGEPFDYGKLRKIRQSDLDSNAQAV